jgi:hypothetical protein
MGERPKKVDKTKIQESELTRFSGQGCCEKAAFRLPIRPTGPIDAILAQRMPGMTRIKRSEEQMLISSSSRAA